MKLVYHLARRVFRRKPKKERGDRPINNDYTLAQRLIDNNWGIRFTFPEAPNAGGIRARRRLAEKQKANKKIPVLTTEPSRQVKHQIERREFKNFRSMVKREQKRDKRNKNAEKRGLIPTS